MTILSQVLTPRQRAAGLELEEDDHTVTLFRDTPSKYPNGEDYTSREIFDRFNITRNSPTITELQEAADRILEKEEHLFSFEEVS